MGKTLVVLSIFLALLFTVPTYGQYSISGVLKNKKNKAVSNAEIILEPSLKSIKSDKKGFFQFEKLAEEKYLLSVFAEEYKEVFITIDLKKDTALALQLVSNVVELGVVISL